MEKRFRADGVEDIKLVERLELAVLKAAEYLQAAVSSQKGLQVERKADKSLVTNLDREAQQIIREVLGTDIATVAEEDESSHSLLTTARDFYLIDPLDGTTSCKRYMDVQGGQIGFGPLAGLVRDGRLVASAYYNLPTKQFFSAVQGQGTFLADVTFESKPVIVGRRRLQPQLDLPLHECGLLFFPGKKGELKIIELLKGEALVENAYRFGGMASDCARLAQGFEQIQVQFHAKAWDFAASLLLIEAGYSVTLHPLTSAIPFESWQLQLENPMIVAPPHLMDEVLRLSRQAQKSKC